MAVEARHLFSPQFLGNRGTVNAIKGSGSVYNAQNGKWTTSFIWNNHGDSAPYVWLRHQRFPPGAVSRKRSRVSSLQPYQNVQNMHPSHVNRCGTFTFLGEDISLQIQQQKMEIDRFIAQHLRTAKVGMEIENRRKRNCRRIIGAVEEGIMKRLRAKEEEIERIGKLNWALEEKVKSCDIDL